MTDADGFALAMLAMLVLSLGFLLGILIVILRNGAKRDRDVEDLIEEVTRQEPKETPAGESPPRQAWERDADWWRKD